MVHLEVKGLDLITLLKKQHLEALFEGGVD